MAVWNKVYAKVNWQNKPSRLTPLGRSKLHMHDDALDIIDDRVIELNNNKADKTEIVTAKSLIASAFQKSRLWNESGLATPISEYGFGTPTTATSEDDGKQYLDLATGLVYACAQQGADTYVWRQVDTRPPLEINEIGKAVSKIWDLRAYASTTFKYSFGNPKGMYEGAGAGSNAYVLDVLNGIVYNNTRTGQSSWTWTPLANLSLAFKPISVTTSSIDLNDYTESGTYTLTSSVSTIANAPTPLTSGGLEETLIVIGGDTKIEQYVIRGSIGYHRTYLNGEWDTSWSAMAGYVENSLMERRQNPWAVPSLDLVAKTFSEENEKRFGAGFHNIAKGNRDYINFNKDTIIPYLQALNTTGTWSVNTNYATYTVNGRIFRVDLVIEEPDGSTTIIDRLKITISGSGSGELILYNDYISEDVIMMDNGYDYRDWKANKLNDAEETPYLYAESGIKSNIIDYGDGAVIDKDYAGGGKVKIALHSGSVSEYNYGTYYPAITNAINAELTNSKTASGSMITLTDASNTNLVECIATISSSTNSITITVKNTSTNSTVTNTYTIDLGQTVSSGTLDVVKGILTTGGTTYSLPSTQIKLLKWNNVISSNVSSLSIKYYPDNVLGQLKGDIEAEYDERVETLESQTQELLPSLTFMSRERRNITSDLDRLSTAVAEQNLTKYGYKIGDYFTGASGYTYILADYNTFKGTTTPYCLTQNHLGIVVDTHQTSQWHSGDASSVGYNGSTLHTYLKGTVMDNIKADMIALFGGSTGLEHLLAHSKLLTTALANCGWQANKYISALTCTQIDAGSQWTANGFQEGEASKSLELFRNYKWTEIFGSEYLWLRNLSNYNGGLCACRAGSTGNLYGDNGVTSSGFVVGLINFY